MGSESILKVSVLGLGPSLSLYKPDGSITVGVNDIWSKVKTDYIVCVDYRFRFDPERLDVIDNSRPIKFITHLPMDEKPKETDWVHMPNYERIKLLPYYPNEICQLNLPEYPKSLVSPFIACAVAFKYLHATEINLYGADMVNHPNIKADDQQRIINHFRNLKVALVQSGCNFIVHGDGILKNL